MWQGSMWGSLFLYVATCLCLNLCEAMALTVSRPKYDGIAFSAKVLHLAPGFTFTIDVDSHSCVPPSQTDTLALCYIPIGQELSLRWSYTAVDIPSEFGNRARRSDVGAINVTRRGGRADDVQSFECPSCGNECQLESPSALGTTTKADLPPLLGDGRLALRPCGSPWSAGMRWSTPVTSADYHTTEIALRASDGAVLGQAMLSWQGENFLQSNAISPRKMPDLQPTRASRDWYAFFKEPPISGVEVVVDVPRMQRGANIAFSVMDKACSPTLPDSDQIGNVFGLARCFFDYDKQMHYQFSLASNTTFDNGDRLELSVFQSWDTANYVQQKMRLASHTCPLCGGVCTFGGGDGQAFLKDFFPTPLSMPACGQPLDLRFNSKQSFPGPLGAPATWSGVARRAMVSTMDWEVAIKKSSGKVVAFVRVRVIPGNIMNEDQRSRFGDMYTNALQPVSSQVDWKRFREKNRYGQKYTFED